MTAPASTALLVQLDRDPVWSLAEDVLPEVVAAWRAIEKGDATKAAEILRGLVDSLRARRDAIEARARELAPVMTCRG